MEGTVGMEPVTIGVIGVGQMGSVHARSMAQLDEVRVVAVAVEVIKAFARVVRARDESLLVATGNDGRRAVELANAILLASCTRRQVALPLNRRRYARLLGQLQRGMARLDGAGGHAASAGARGSEG